MSKLKKKKRLSALKNKISLKTLKSHTFPSVFFFLSSLEDIFSLLLEKKGREGAREGVERGERETSM